MDLDRRDGACQGSATGDVRSTFTKRAPVDEEPEVASTGWKDHIVETVMSGSPVMVSADEPIANVADLLAGFEISGVPVVDDDNRLIGVISETDLVRVPGIDRRVAGMARAAGQRPHDDSGEDHRGVSAPC